MFLPWLTRPIRNPPVNTCRSSVSGQRLVQFSLVAQSCLTLCNPMDRSTPGLPVHHQLPQFTQTMSTESVMPSNHLILYHPLLLPPSVFPSIRVFSNESAACLYVQINTDTQDFQPLGHAAKTNKPKSSGDPLQNFTALSRRHTSLFQASAPAPPGTQLHGRGTSRNRRWIWGLELLLRGAAHGPEQGTRGQAWCKKVSSRDPGSGRHGESRGMACLRVHRPTGGLTGFFLSQLSTFSTNSSGFRANIS